MGTVASLWADLVARDDRTPLFLVRDPTGWLPVTAAEAAHAVDEVAAGLLAIGVAAGDRVAILSRTRLEWALVDLAAASIGAVSVGIYPTSSPADCAYVVRDSRSSVLVCEDDEALERVGAARDDVANLVLLDGARPDALSLDELRARGRSFLAKRPDAVRAARATVGADDVAALVYTSGTAGTPRGCVLTQGDFAALVESVRGVPRLLATGDVGLLFLPLAHTFGRTILYALASIRGTLAFCPDPAAIPAALREVRPTILPSSPRLFERVHAAVVAGFERERGPKRAIASWALGVGRRVSAERQAGRAPGALLAAQHALADRLVYGKVKARLGGRLRHAISGGAALGAEVARFFHALDVLVLEGYGLTECGVVAVNRPDAYRFGTIGRPLPGVEVRVADDGELLVRAEHVFLGYHDDPDGTAAALDDEGWLRTGDIVTQDADGFLTLTERKKDVVVLAGGKNVAPQKVEAALRASPVVANALVVGDDRPYLVALVAVDAERACALGESLGPAVDAAVAAANRELGRDEQVRRFHVLERDFTEADGELTPTLKVRRRVLADRYRDEIERLYAGRAAPQ